MTALTRKGFIGALAAAAAGGTVGSSAQARPRSEGARPLQIAARRTLIRNADVATMNAAFEERLGVDVLIVDGKIAAIGKNLETGDAQVIDATGMILMPGMSDGHRHVWGSIGIGRLTRTMHQTESYAPWKLKMMVAMTEEDHYWAAYYGGLQAIDSGVTNVLDHAHIQHTGDLAVASARGLRDSGVAGWFGYQVAHTPTYGLGATISLSSGENERHEYLDEQHMQAAERLQRDVFTDSSAPLQLGLAPSNGVWGAPMEQIVYEFQRMRALGVGLITQHNRRTPSPAGHYGHQASGIPDMKDAGILGPDYHTSHATDLTTDELHMLRDTGGMVTATNEFSYVAHNVPGGRRGPVHGRAREAGVAVGLGVDTPVTVRPDYFDQIRGARNAMYLDREDWPTAAKYKAHDYLDMATRMGAASLRMGDVSGSIEVGKRADMVLLRTDRFSFPKMGELAGKIVDFASISDIDSVWASGRLLKHGGRLMGVDVPALEARIARLQQEIEARAATITIVA